MDVRVSNGVLNQEEIDAYMEMAQTKYADKIVGLEINIENDDEVTLTYILKEVAPFERIRRITGYLVGTLDKWNDAKRAEERDRVKHTVNKDIGDNA